MLGFVAEQMQLFVVEEVEEVGSSLGFLEFEMGSVFNFFLLGC